MERRRPRGPSATITVGTVESGVLRGEGWSRDPLDERDVVLEAGYPTADSGTGFGLSIVKQIATAHEWSVGDSDAELGMIHVRPSSWNEGIGTQLVDAAIETVPASIAGIVLRVLQENERARSFYERRGFEQIGTTRTRYGGEEFREVVYRRSM